MVHQAVHQTPCTIVPPVSCVHFRHVAFLRFKDQARRALPVSVFQCAASACASSAGRDEDALMPQSGVKRAQVRGSRRRRLRPRQRLWRRRLSAGGACHSFQAAARHTLLQRRHSTYWPQWRAGECRWRVIRLLWVLSYGAHSPGVLADVICHARCHAQNENCQQAAKFSHRHTSCM